MIAGSRYHAVSIRISWIRDIGHQHMPSAEAWLIGKHRMSGEENGISPICPRFTTRYEVVMRS